MAGTNHRRRVFDGVPRSPAQAGVEQACLPLDLGAIDANRRAALAWLRDHEPDPAECRAVKDTVGVVFDLVAELDDLRERLAAFERLPFRDEYSVFMPGEYGDGDGSRAWKDDAQQAQDAAARSGGTPQSRRIYTTPWGDLPQTQG